MALKLIQGKQIATASWAINALTASYALNANINTGSFAITGSNIFKGGQIISGSITLEGGSKITNEYDYHSVDIQAGAGGYVELLSNNTQTQIWVTDENAYIVTSGLYAWIFDQTGSTIMPGGVTAPSFTGSLFGTSSFAISSSISSNTILQTGITSNATVGGATAPRTFNAGTSLESIIRTMLVTYIAPTIGNFTLLNGGTSVLSGNAVVEVSSSYTFNTASFTAVADDPNGRYAYSASFTASGASTGNFNYFFGNSVLGSSNNLGLGGSQIVNNSTNGTVTFTLRGINPETNVIISQSRTATYVYPYYYGMSAVDYSTTGNVSASLTQLTQAQGTKTVSITGSSAYVYFCQPAAYTDLTSIKDGNGFEVLSSFTKYTRNQDGAPGKWAGISYDIYKSNTLTNVSPAQNYIFT